LQLFRREAVEHATDRLSGEVVFSQPLSVRIFAAVLFTIIAIAAAWLTIGSYARIETVPGRLVTDTPSAKIVARQTGVVTEMAVIEGQIVAAGDRLLVIDSDREAAAGGDVAGRGLGSIAAREELTQAQVSLTQSGAAAERDRLLAVITSAEDETASLIEQIALQEAVVASNKQIFDRIEEVVDRGFVSKIEFERRRQTLLSSQQSLSSLKQRKAASLSRASQARSQLARVNIDTATGVSRLQDSLQVLTAERARLQGEQAYVVTAPIAGRVTALTIGEGRPANPNRPMMVIVPIDATLTAELYAPSRAIGLVEPGKETRLLYDAFPYQRFGSFGGTVTSISRIAIDPRETDIPFPFEEPVYRVKVALDQQAIDAFGEPTPLQAGMTLQANVVLERQSFLSWLLQPLNAVLNRTS